MLDSSDMNDPNDATFEETRTREIEPFSPTLARKRSFEPLPPAPTATSVQGLWFAVLAVGLLGTLAVGYVLGTHLFV